MAISNRNFFAMLEDNEDTDASSISAQIIVAPPPPVADSKDAKKQPPAPAPAKLPSKPLPPAEAVREAQKSFGGDRGRGRGLGRGRGGGGRFRGGAEGEESTGGYRPRLPPAEGTENGPPAEGAGGNFRGRGGGPGLRGRGRGRGRARESDNNNNAGDDTLANGGAFEEDPNELRKERSADRGFYFRGERFLRGRGPEPPAQGGVLGGADEKGERGGDKGADGEHERQRDRDRDRDLPFRRSFDRRNMTGRNLDVKRSGAGRGNWGTAVEPEEVEAAKEEVATGEAEAETEAPKVDAEDVQEPQELTEEQKEKEKEEKEMTLDEYEKMLVEKRKSLVKGEERKVEPDKVFATMQLVDKKSKSEEDVFIKLGSDKSKKKEADKDDKSKKAVSINEFLKPEVGNNYRGRGRGVRGGPARGAGNSRSSSAPGMSPDTSDIKQFPTLGGGN